MFKTLWQERKKLVEQRLGEELPAEGALDDRLNEAMRYSLLAGGKRLRPIMLMAAADAVGKKGEDFITAACALEMVHVYSLIHDDLPAMDNDDYRRGKLTNHKVYGDDMAILAGDALLTLSFEVLLRQTRVSHAALLTAVRELSVAAGMNGMVGGQAIDIQAEGQKPNLALMQKMHMGKTGAMFRAAIRIGGILAGADKTSLKALTVYAEKFGLAFQITDDILDVTGDEKVLGKPVGSDERNGKATYVTLTSLAQAQKLAENTVAEAKAAIADLGERADFLQDLADYLISRDK